MTSAQEPTDWVSPDTIERWARGCEDASLDLWAAMYYQCFPPEGVKGWRGVLRRAQRLGADKLAPVYSSEAVVLDAIEEYWRYLTDKVRAAREAGEPDPWMAE